MENHFVQRQEQIIEEFQNTRNWEERYKKIIKMGKNLPDFGSGLRQERFLVKGCQSQVWLQASRDENGGIALKADSDALIVKGLVAILYQVYNGAKPEEIMSSSSGFIEKLGFANYLSPSRANGFLSMLKQIHLYATAFIHLDKGKKE